MDYETPCRRSKNATQSLAFMTSAFLFILHDSYSPHFSLEERIKVSTLLKIKGGEKKEGASPI